MEISEVTANPSLQAGDIKQCYTRPLGRIAAVHTITHRAEALSEIYPSQTPSLKAGVGWGKFWYYNH